MHRVLYRFLVSLATLLLRSGRSKDLEIVVLRHHLSVLRRQNTRPSRADADRTLPGTIAAAVPRARRAGWLLTPTCCCAGTANASPPTGRAHTAAPDGPPSPLASAGWPCSWRARPHVGYRRIHGELVGLGHRIGVSTVWQILKDAGIDPAPTRPSATCSQLLHSQTAIACDFARVDTVLARRFYVLFFIDVTSRQIIPERVTANPTAPWTLQAARNLFPVHSDRLANAKPPARDRRSNPVCSPPPSTRCCAPKASRS